MFDHKRVPYPIIDADSHVEEPEAVFDFLDPAYQARRPVVVQRPLAPGSYPQDAAWLIDGEVFPKPFGKNPSVYGTPVTSSFARSKPFLVESQAITPASARLADLDAWGIDVQVLFPTIFLDVLTGDTRFEAAVMRAYNDWIASRCAEAPDRLKWVAAAPVRRPGDAAAEVERARQKGAAGVCVYGTAGETLFHDPDLDVFWAACERLKMPVAMHTGWSSRTIHQMTDTIFSATTLGAIPVLMGFFSVVGGGVLDRFPGLKVGFFEIGSEWLPYWVRRMDRYAGVYTELKWSGPPKRRPSEYLRAGNVYVACEGDEPHLRDVIDLIGADHVLTSADMPHAEDVENSIQDILDREDLSPEEKRKILNENPARFYNLA